MGSAARRFGVVGLGAFGETYVQCLSGLRAALGVEVSAVCSRSAERAREIATRYGVPRWETDPAALASLSEVDVVCVVTAEHDHAAPVLAALAAGKKVIVEKPLATTLAEADAMIAAAREANRHLLVGHLLRFVTLYQGVAERVHAGDLGEIASLHTRRNRPARAVARYRRTHPLLETGILDIDLMLWLTRSRVERVRAVARTVHPGPTPDLVWALLEFASGAVGVVETSWLAPDAAGIFTDDALSVVGSRGSARIDLSRAPAAVWTESGYALPDPFYSPTVGGDIGGAFREQMIGFIHHLRTGEAAEPVPLAEVRHGLAVALAAIQAAEEGRTIAPAA